VEARAAFEQATDLRRELEEMGKEMRARRKGAGALRREGEDSGLAGSF